MWGMVSHLSKTDMCGTVFSKNPSDLHNLRRHTRSSVHYICITECLACARSCSELVEYTGEQRDDPWCQGSRGAVGRPRHTLKKHFVGSEQSKGGCFPCARGTRLADGQQCCRSFTSKCRPLQQSTADCCNSPRARGAVWRDMFC